MRRLLLFGSIALAGCARPPPHPGVTAPQVPIGTGAPIMTTTVDGIPILVAKPNPPTLLGDLVILEASAKVLQFPASSASDGEHVFAALDGEGAGFIVRDGVVSEDVLPTFGIAKHGCVAARDGELGISGVVDGAQVLFRVKADGKTEKTVIDRSYGMEDSCRLWLGPNGTWALGLNEIITFDGKTITRDRDRYTGRLVLGSPTSPRYCFGSCNEAETRANPPKTAALNAALPCATYAGQWAAMDNWLGVACGKKAIRYSEGGEIESIGELPPSKMLNGDYQAVFVANGDLVIGLDYGYRKYVVWKKGTKALTPIRALDPNDVLAAASPTMVVRKSGVRAPAPEIAAVVLSTVDGYGANGPTYGYDSERHGAAAHRAATARALAVMPSKNAVVAGEAVVDLDCGNYVRSPIGWEGERWDDWTPPTYPPLSPKAVTKQAPCVPLSRVFAVPGQPDLLFGVTAKKELWAAWLPVKLPLPEGSSALRGDPQPPAPKQNPKPGAGWFAVGGSIDDAFGIDAAPAPGENPKIMPRTWLAAGAAIFQVDGAEIVLTPRGPVTLPPHTTPMAVSVDEPLHLWGALEKQLVDCTSAGCRIVDPRANSEIVGIVPRSNTDLIVKLSNGKIGAYSVPSTGGIAVPAHPLTAKINAALEKRPKE